MSEMHEKLKRVTKNITVLYAEDEEIVRSQYDSIFKLLFKEVKSVDNGEIALEEYKQKKYDLLITDLTMPRMNGVSLISEILQINPLQHTIIMTAHNTTENLRNSIDFQVDGILLKPVAMDKLFSLLYKICHLIYYEKKDNYSMKEDKKLNHLIQNNEQALFLVVVNKFKEIKKEFGSETKSHIFDSVQEHLSHFGIEEHSTIKLENDVFICGVNKKYIDTVLESLQSFSDNHNTLRVIFDKLKIYITLSYGVIMLNNDFVHNSNDNFIEHINEIVHEIKNDEDSTFVVKMDVDMNEAEKNNSLSWLGVTLDALKQDTVIPFYQPIVDINTLDIYSYEIFSRIKQGDKYILPKFFIDLSKKAGILEDISKTVFDKGFAKLSNIEYPFHINMGDSELRDSSIEAYLIYLSANHKIDHNRIILDIMDYELLNPSGKIIESILRLKKLGYKIALKEFASGNINIELISILKPDYIKINQILIEKSLSDEHIKDALNFILKYIEKANIKSILVGVESENIVEEGKKLGFDYIQGYFIAKPSSEI